MAKRNTYFEDEVVHKKIDIKQFGRILKYIMPYKHLADFDIDTFFPYELSVYRSVLAKLCDNDFDECIRQVNRYSELPRFLSLIKEVPPEAVPENSLVKEFIG